MSDSDTSVNNNLHGPRRKSRGSVMSSIVAWSRKMSSRDAGDDPSVSTQSPPTNNTAQSAENSGVAKRKKSIFDFSSMSSHDIWD